PDPTHTAGRTHTRPCHCQTHPTYVGRVAPGRDRFPVPGASPAGSEGLDRGLLGALRQRQAGQVLSANAPGGETAPQRAIQVGGVLARHRVDPKTGKTGGMMQTFMRKLLWLTRRRRKEAELRAELQFHLEEEAEERREAGLPQEQAKWEARRELGNVALVEE